MMSGQPQPSEDGTMNFRYPYTRSYRDRHGKLRIEYRRNGKTKPLRGTPGTAEFQAAYDAAASEIDQTQSAVSLAIFACFGRPPAQTGDDVRRAARALTC